MPTFLFLEVSPSLTERSRSFLGFVLGPAFLHGQFSLGGCAAYTQRRDDNETADHSGSPWLTVHLLKLTAEGAFGRVESIHPPIHPCHQSSPLDHDGSLPLDRHPHIQGPPLIDQAAAIMRA